MREVPRHLFVSEKLQSMAYQDRPLPIGGGQTISQPLIVALMSHAADIQEHERCLEIGTGSGYQAAVLALLCREVSSIEYLPDVAALGRKNLERAGYAERVRLRVGDGYLGWPDAAPFDAILVTAAPEVVPKPLLEQLAQGGVLVIPVGTNSDVQQLERWIRTGPGSTAFKRDVLTPVRFVPFLGGRDKTERPETQ
jgi:protein-L-isoaspartate(D-aspartate) O-methyltransferase